MLWVFDLISTSNNSFLDHRIDENVGLFLFWVCNFSFQFELSSRHLCLFRDYFRFLLIFLTVLKVERFGFFVGIVWICLREGDEYFLTASLLVFSSKFPHN